MTTSAPADAPSIYLARSIPALLAETVREHDKPLGTYTRPQRVTLHTTHESYTVEAAVWDEESQSYRLTLHPTYGGALRYELSADSDEFVFLTVS